MTPPRICSRVTLLLAALVLPTVAWAGEPSTQAKRLNVIFLFSDDQRFDTIHALGNDAIRTPHLDRLVERGFTFTHNHVMGSTCPAVCYPSRAMLMSGRSLWRAPLQLEGVPTWPETMKHNGYATFGTGKWHNGPNSYARSFTHGGAIFFGGMNDHFHMPVFEFSPTGQYPVRDRHIVGQFSSELFADRAIDFLRRRPADQPFFMYVAFTAPHDPRTPPGQYATMYDPASIPVPENFLPEHPFDNGELKIRDELLAPFPRTPEIVRQHTADYYGMISHLDAQIGRILETLEATGVADQTVIVFSSDNGLAVGRHGLMGKQNLYEHSQRIPLVLAGPGIPQGCSDALVYLYDLFPTVCDLTGVPVPAGVEGKSLVPVMRGEKPQVRDWILGAYKDVRRSIRRGDWKLIRYHVRGQSTTQLFNLQSDPGEKNNLAADPSCAPVRQELEDLLATARREMADPVDFPAEPPPK